MGAWQPVIRGEPSPFKGSVVVVGAGICGSLLSSMFALRGFHVTVIESSSEGSPPLFGSESALVTKRALDVLESCGVRKQHLKTMGTRVTGILDHPTGLNNFFTRGLSELHPFAVNMLSVDLKTLRLYLNDHLTNKIPWRNAKIFYDHRCVAVLPDVRKAVVLPLRGDSRDIKKRNKRRPGRAKEAEEAAAAAEEEESEFAKTKEVIIGGKRFFEDVEGVDFDLLVACDGVNSPIRSMIAQEGTEYTNKQYGVKWWSMENAGDMDSSVIHRWAHKFPEELDPEKNLGLVCAYPRGSETGCFSVMAYLPMQILQRSSTQDLIDRYCGSNLQGTIMEGTETTPTLRPTVFNQDLYNKEGSFSPNICLLGDAAHTVNPYLQQDLSLALEDVAYCINTIDQQKVTLPDALRQFSRERGVAGDRLRVVTERALYYAHARHWHPLERFRNFYAHTMHYACPRSWNEIFQGHNNYLYPRSVEVMMNGRGYTSYEQLEAAQTRANKWWHFCRLYS